MLNHQIHKDILDAAPDAMIIVDANSKIIMVNLEAEILFGYEKEELEGKPLDTLIPGRYHCAHLGHVSNYFKKPNRRPMGMNKELFAVNKQGEEFPVEISLGPVKIGDDYLVSTTIRDISKRKASEEKIKSALNEKETLLKEIHHRVKNNLAIVSGFLGLQLDSIEDENTQCALEQTQNRIFTMSLIHQKLYQSSNLSSIDVNDFLSNLVDHLIQTYKMGNHRVNAEYYIEPINLSLDQAIPCGLIVNELVTNSLKYAFPDRSGTIFLSLQIENKQTVCLIVNDNGVGFPKDFDIEARETLGISLVRNLTMQLEGELQLDLSSDSQKSKIKIHFPLTL